MNTDVKQECVVSDKLDDKTLTQRRLTSGTSQTKRNLGVPRETTILSPIQVFI
jgi:hypothetical protein